MSPEIVADRRLYMTRDQMHACEEGDPDAAFLLAAKGRPIAAEHVKRLGLTMDGDRVVIPGEEPVEAEATPPEEVESEALEPEPEEEEEEAEVPDWPLSRYTPEEYLEQYGDDAKNAELARQVIAAREN